MPTALNIWRKRSTYFRALLPMDTEPPKILGRCPGIFWATSVGVQVLDSHNKGSASLASPLPSRKKCARVTHVQIAGRGGCKSAAIACFGRWREASHAL